MLHFLYPLDFGRWTLPTGARTFQGTYSSRHYDMTTITTTIIIISIIIVILITSISIISIIVRN